MVEIKRYKKAVLILISLLLPNCFQVLSFSQNVKNGEARENPPLRYRLIVSKPAVCAKEGITLELELQNTTDHRISIDPRGLLHTVEISRPGAGIVPTGDLTMKVTRDQAVGLAPDQSYRKTIRYPLQSSIFSVADVYTIKVTYGQFTDPFPALPDLYKGVVDSNSVLFEIKDCDGTSR